MALNRNWQTLIGVGKGWFDKWKTFKSELVRVLVSLLRVKGKAGSRFCGSGQGIGEGIGKVQTVAIVNPRKSVGNTVKKPKRAKRGHKIALSE